MDYSKDILERLLDMYERRGAFSKEASSLRAIQLDVKKTYPKYTDRYEHSVYQEINAAIEHLTREELVDATLDVAGNYIKLKLRLEQVPRCYAKLRRKSVPQQCEEVACVLDEFVDCKSELLARVIADWHALLLEYRKLPYDLKFNSLRIYEVLQVLVAVLELKQETYVRNFSTALFKDSKRFQKEFKATVESILCDYTVDVIEKEHVLEYYNLYENPTYVLIKGDVKISFANSIIVVRDIIGGLALPNISLEQITGMEVFAKQVVTVENLTTYHDMNEAEAVYIYLGGYHNTAKQNLLEKLYKQNKQVAFYHMGDLDVHGFMILENLQERTGIPFKPLFMDLMTLKRFYNCGLYKELSSSDVKLVKEQLEGRLSAYKEVLAFMLEKNCKVEQESLKALELLHK